MILWLHVCKSVITVPLCPSPKSQGPLQHGMYFFIWLYSSPVYCRNTLSWSLWPTRQTLCFLLASKSITWTSQIFMNTALARYRLWALGLLQGANNPELPVQGHLHCQDLHLVQKSSNISSPGIQVGIICSSTAGTIHYMCRNILLLVDFHT